MRVLHYIAAFFPEPTGATYSSFRLVKSLERRGVASRYVVDDRGGTWRSEGRHEGVPVQSFPFTRPGKWGKLRTLCRFSAYLFRHRRDVDLYHVHGGDHVSLFLAWWVQTLFRKPALLKITSNQWDSPDGVRAGRHGRVMLFLYRRLRGIVAMTSGQRSVCQAYGVKGVTAVIPNGVDTERFHPVKSEEQAALRRSLQLPPAGPILCCVSWLGHGKGTDVLLRVWDLLRRQGMDTHLLLVGNYAGGIDSPETWRAFLAEAGLDPALASHPGITRVGRTEDVPRYLQASDLFVFPSRQEGFGTVQTEAMACGLPCVVNDLPGVSVDIFPDERVGFRIENNEVERYAEVIRDLLGDPARMQAVGRAARERVCRHFSTRHVAEAYRDFYARLLQR